jgi:prolyl-tRNA synthetase
VSRAVAAIAEQHHDEKGLIWPREVSPADIHLIATGKDDEPFEFAEKLALELESAGIRILYDDRKVSPGIKFNDAELLGIPTIVTVGKLLVDGKIEIKDRATGAKTEVEIALAVSQIISTVRG